MALLRATQKDEASENAKVVVNPGKLAPKAVISVTGKPSFASVLTFQRDALSGTTFKFTVADATIRNLKSVQGYQVSGKRTDGWLTTEVVHDFGSNDTKGKFSVKQARDGRVYSADYLHFASKPTGGIVDAAVEVNKGLKLAAGYNLANGLASLNVTKKDGELTYNAAVNSRQAVKLGVTRKQRDTTWAATYILPVVVAATVPVTQEGVGDLKVIASYERTYLI